MSTFKNEIQGPKDEDFGMGYILKTDPMKVLLDREVQKMEYNKALKEQMEINNQKKSTE
jgi:hypothetical protein